MMEKNAKIYVAGHRGLTGAAIVRELQTQGYTNIIGRTHAELDLEDPAATDAFFAAEKPDYVINAAARVGGIMDSNTYQAEFLQQNFLIQSNVLNSAYKHGTHKYLFMGTSCIYPRHCPQPMKPEYLGTGELEPTCEGYALAKVAGIKQCQYFRKQYNFNAICIMPPNLYGSEDDFRPEQSHFVQGMMRRMHEAKLANAPEVTIWGTGKPRRELMFVDDMAKAAVYFMNTYNDGEILNTGVNEDKSIAEWAEVIKKVVGYEGVLVFDTSKPDGVLQKLMDSSVAHSLGWKPKVTLEEGLTRLYTWYAANTEEANNHKKHKEATAA